MGISIKEAENNKLISKRALSFLPKTCRCGKEIVLSDSLKKLKCTNKSCINTVLNRCNNFCKLLGIKIIPEELVYIVDKLHIITPYQLLMLDEAFDNKLIDESCIQDIQSCIQKIKDIKQREYFIYEIIELSGIREISSIAKKLFYGFNSIDEIFEEIETSRVIFFNERLGINSSDSTTISVEIYNRVLNLREELIFAETQLKTKKHTNVLRVAFADNNIGNFVNKGELIEYLENKYNYTILHINSITANTDILIKSGSISGAKIRIARTINEKFIADKINDGTLKLNDIGKKVNGVLKPTGSIVYIDTLENILDRLDSMVGDIDD